MQNNLKSILKNSSFIFNEDINVWTKEKVSPFMYSDGDDSENYLISVLEQTQDHSVYSVELKKYIKDWPSLYHLSSRRTNLLQPFKEWLRGKRVLEIGCGCGAITRFLAEVGCTVVAVEGSIRRARIARKRCDGLENVNIICCPSNKLPNLGKFDVILLIGVLEYANMFLGQDGDEILLHDCHQRLHENGKLFIAIENKIGAKYLAGAKEDHLALPMVGVNDAYTDTSVRTYTRQELLTKLHQVGFENNEEFIPLPEYKLPTTIVSPVGHSQFSNELSSLATESVYADAQGVEDYNFSLEQFNNIIWKNGLSSELSNSFLIVAGVHPDEKMYDRKILGWHFSDSRSQENNKEKVFLLNSDNEIDIIVKKLTIKNSAELSREHFLAGESIWREIVRVINTPNWTIEELTEIFKKWLSFISPSPTQSVTPYHQPIASQYFDALPFNIMKDNMGECTIFDQEWDTEKNCELGFIAYRGVFHSLFRIKSFEYTSFVSKKTFFELTSQILLNIWPDLQSDSIREWVEKEANFSKKSGGGDFKTLLDVAIFSSINYRANTTQLKYDKLIVDNELSATKVHVNNLVGQIDFLNNQLDSLNENIILKSNYIESLEIEKSRILNSTSWKITKPLRFTRRLISFVINHFQSNLNKLRLLLVTAINIVTKKMEQLGGVKPFCNWLWQRYQLYGINGLSSKIKRTLTTTVSNHPAQPTTFFDYTQWIAVCEKIDDVRLAEFSLRQSEFKLKPKISIVMPCYNAPVEYLREAIHSVINQVYQNWELCIADDASTSESTLQALKEYENFDKRIKIIFRNKNGHISIASNSALTLATGEYIALMDQDDLLPQHALYRLVVAINEYPDAQLFYSDEDKISSEGVRCEPYFKPDWNRDLFLSQNMFSHLGIFKKNVIDKIGGFREGFEGSQDYDLVLRCLDHVDAQQIIHIPEILYHWRIIPGSTASGGDQKPYAFLAGVRAVEDFIARNNIKARVEEAKPGMRMLRVKYELPVRLPLVSIIIPTRNAKSLVKQCIDSICEKTTYTKYEIIIVDNGSDEKESLDYFSSLNLRENITVIRDDGEFNFSRLNNRAVGIAKGEILCLMNNDIEIISPEWLGELVSQAMRPEVGAVGAKLLYPNDTVQHAGIILGLGGIAGHAHLGIHRNDPGYFGRACLVQNFIAVTAACLAIRKDIYEQVGGLNEKDFAVAFNDVDFCIRVYQAGYQNVWTPFAELYHHESATRGSDLAPDKIERFKQEIYSMEKLHGDLLKNDPAYNPNLSLDLSVGSFTINTTHLP